MLTQTELIVDAICSLFWIWLIQLLPLFIIGIPIWLITRKRIKWNKWDILVGIIPFFVWCVLTLTYNNGKGIGNIIEGLLIGCFTPISPIVRAVVRDKMNQVVLSASLLIFISFTAVGLWAFMPGMIG